MVDGGASIPFRAESGQVLRDFAKDRKPYVASQYVTGRRRFAARNSPGVDEATVSEAALREFEASWEEPAVQLHLIPGKEALGAINRHLQARYGVTVTSTAIIDAMRTDEVPAEMKDLIQQLTVFTKTRVS